MELTPILKYVTGIFDSAIFVTSVVALAALFLAVTGIMIMLSCITVFLMYLEGTWPV
jgi:hypothetical protein